MLCHLNIRLSKCKIHYLALIGPLTYTHLLKWMFSHYFRRKKNRLKHWVAWENTYARYPKKFSWMAILPSNVVVYTNKWEWIWVLTFTFKIMALKLENTRVRKKLFESFTKFTDIFGLHSTKDSLDQKAFLVFMF